MAEKNRLDIELVRRGLVASRSQAESFIKLGQVAVDGRVETKPGFFVNPVTPIRLTASEQYVSRAGLKLASVAALLGLHFNGAVVLDVGSSTGGFTDYALRHGAKRVYAVDVGTEQLHPSLRSDKRIDLYEKTDIRDVFLASSKGTHATDVPLVAVRLEAPPDIVVMDVSFISLRDILPHIATHLCGPKTQIVAMVKPQFEAGRNQASKGVIKNDSIRRQILKDFEVWAKQYFIIKDKRDSEVAGAKGNRERFYLLTLNRNSTTSPGRMT